MQKKFTLKIFFLVLFLLLISSFIILSILVSNEATKAIDASTIEFVQSFSSPTVTYFMVFISFFGDGFYPVVIFLSLALLLIFSGHKREFYFSFLIWFGPLASWFMKMLVSRTRPQEYLTSGYPLPNDFGFPSGHAVFYVVFFGLVILYSLTLPRLKNIERKILIAISMSLILLIGLSRIYLGVHWPIDVLAGYLLGFALLELLVVVYPKFIHLPQMRDK